MACTWPCWRRELWLWEPAEPGGQTRPSRSLGMGLRPARPTSTAASRTGRGGPGRGGVQRRRGGGFAGRVQVRGKGGTLWTTALEERQLQLTENFFLPGWWGTICSREYVPYERPWTEEEEEAAKEGVIRKFTENLVEKGVQIEENNARIVENDSGFRVEGRAVLLEPIGVGKPIPEEEIPALEENDRAE